MLQRSKWSAATVLVLLLAVAAMGQIGSVKVYACDLTDLSCLSGTTNPYLAGQQDASYDHTNNLQYNPVAACCHSQDWSDQFTQGYNAEWNQYQSQSQTANVDVNNSPGAIVSVNQKSNQDQGPSISGCENQCGNPCSGSCDSEPICGDSCGGPCNFGCNNFGFHHFGFHHYWHLDEFGYRHVGFGNVDP